MCVYLFYLLDTTINIAIKGNIITINNDYSLEFWTKIFIFF